jgi:hypothetical protein
VFGGGCQDVNSWTPAEGFPDLADRMDSGFKRVPLKQLFSHTAGLPSDNETFGNLLKESLSREGNLDEIRYWLVAQWSRRPRGRKAEEGLLEPAHELYRKFR